MNKELLGILAATALAHLVVADFTPVAQAADDAKIKCSGINACKGTSECKTAGSACHGKNTCKGKGWTTTTAKDCTDKGGKVVTEEPKKAEKKG